MPDMEELPRVGLEPEALAAKRIAQRESVLAMLKAAGREGCTSEQLNTVAFRYSAVIHTLRHKEGYMIETIGRSKTELCRYVLTGRSRPGDQGSLF